MSLLIDVIVTQIVVVILAVVIYQLNKKLNETRTYLREKVENISKYDIDKYRGRIEALENNSKVDIFISEASAYKNACRMKIGKAVNLIIEHLKLDYECKPGTERLVKIKNIIEKKTIRRRR